MGVEADAVWTTARSNRRHYDRDCRHLRRSSVVRKPPSQLIWHEVCKTCLPEPDWPRDLQQLKPDLWVTPEGIRIRDLGGLWSFATPNGYSYRYHSYKIDAVEYVTSGAAVAEMPVSDGKAIWTTDSAKCLHWSRDCHYFIAEDREDTNFRYVSASYPRPANEWERKHKRRCSSCDPRKREDPSKSCPVCHEVPSLTGECQCD
jgi:hypothetical protein